MKNSGQCGPYRQRKNKVEYNVNDGGAGGCGDCGDCGGVVMEVMQVVDLRWEEE